MAESPPKPHVVQRQKPVAEPPPKKVVEARPTCKLDKNELLGLVGNMRTPTADPDAEPEVEVVASTDAASPASKPTATTPSAPVEKKIVRTVARRRTPVVGMAPLNAEPAPAPVAAKPAAQPADGYVDLFAEGSEPSIDPVHADRTSDPSLDIDGAGRAMATWHGTGESGSWEVMTNRFE